MMTVMAPAALSCSAVTGSPLLVKPTTIRPKRARRSCKRRGQGQNTAMTSEAAVISKPV